jgi:hypothetical protein
MLAAEAKTPRPHIGDVSQFEKLCSAEIESAHISVE